MRKMKRLFIFVTLINNVYANNQFHHLTYTSRAVATSLRSIVDKPSVRTGYFVMGKNNYNFRKEERLQELRKIAGDIKRINQRGKTKNTQKKSIPNSHPKSNFKPYQDKNLSYFIKTSDTICKPPVKKFKEKGLRQTSLGERLVADWLVKNGIRFKREKEFGDLINPMTGKTLLVDFYLHAHKICIEFDGRQHFKASKLFDRNGDSLEARVQRDRIKDSYCKSRGLKMIRIKYYEINLIHDILSKYFTLNSSIV